MVGHALGGSSFNYKCNYRGLKNITKPNHSTKYCPGPQVFTTVTVMLYLSTTETGICKNTRKLRMDLPKLVLENLA